MVETPREIEAQIDRTRERLGSHLKELGHKVDAATDWREHYRARPHVFLGAAFAGGASLAIALHKRSQRSRVDDTNNPFAPDREFAPARVVEGSTQAQVLELWQNIKGALIGVASMRVLQFLGELVPDFGEHYQRAEQRTGRLT